MASPRGPAPGSSLATHGQGAHWLLKAISNSNSILLGPRHRQGGLDGSVSRAGCLRWRSRARGRCRGAAGRVRDSGGAEVAFLFRITPSTAQRARAGQAGIAPGGPVPDLVGARRR